MLRFTENRRQTGLSATTNPRASMSAHGLVEATQAQAEGGTVTGRFMSPLRVAQAIAAIPGTGAALTKTDDTNITLTLGGTPTTAVLRATSITVGWTGTLAAARLNSNVVQAVSNDTNITGSISAQTLTFTWASTLSVARGGTGLASGTSGGIPYYSGSTTIASSAALAAGQVVVGGGAGTTPATISNGQLPATSTNDSASAGKVGEFIESEIVAASSVGLTTGTAKSVTSLSLTAGDWDVCGEVAYKLNAATTMSLIAGVLGTTVDTWSGVVTQTGKSSISTLTFSTGQTQTIRCGPARFSLSGTTTVYLTAFANFAVNTCDAYGYISARRVR